ncbi:hypothetical protein ACJ41O_010126 [Fusarium nematophilum]
MTDLLSENQAYFKLCMRHRDALEGRIPAWEEPFQEDFMGTDVVLQTLDQYTSESIGIDLSENMVGAFNAQAQSQGSSRKAYQGNLSDPDDSSPSALSDSKFFNFDLAGVGLGFHHFDDCELATKRLSERLKPGGVLFIVDFVAHKMDPEQTAGRGITHHGFTEDQIKTMFEGAGLANFGYEELSEPIKFKDFHASAMTLAYTW